MSIGTTAGAPIRASRSVGARSWGISAMRRTLLGVLAIGLALESAAVLLTPSSSTFSELAFGPIAFVAFAAGAGLCTLRAVAVHEARPAWALLATVAWLWVGGNVTYSVFVLPLADPPFPSVADAFFLALYPLALAGLICLARSSNPRGHLRGVMVLDALVVSFTIAAAAEIAVINPLRQTLGGSFVEVAATAAYPLGDVVLAMTIATVFALYRWRPPRAVALIGLGIVVFTVADSIYLIRVADGSFVAGSAFDLLWSFGFAIIALAASQPAAQPPSAREDRGASMTIPTTFAGVAVGLLIIGTLRPISLVGVAAATAAIAASLGRIFLAMGDLRSLARARHEATTDELTGVHNRRGFFRVLDARLEEEQRPGRALGLFVLDLDNFKALNSLGHGVGDTILQRAAQRIARSAGPSGHVGRVGGDKFAILVGDDLPFEGIAHRIADGLAEPFVIDGASFAVGTSVGISLFPRHGATGDALMSHADLAMHEAKRSATSIQFYDPKRDDRNKRRIALMTELPLALDHEEFELHYQPKLELATDEVTSVEALIRWRHPHHGLLAPGEFLSIAEQLGLMRRLTSWVIRTALRETAPSALRVAVNASASSLLDGGFAAEVAALLADAGVGGEALLIEITEDVLMVDADAARDTIRALAELGVEVSLDDFGTGYSSLAYLHQLDVDELKIDRSFVAQMDIDESTVIIRALVSLAHDLGLRVVAEGLETEESIARIRQLGCDVAQGYAISRPVPLPELVSWLSTHRTPDNTLRSVA